MQLLITGGLGFIGSNLVRHLLKTHPTYSIINIDALTYAGHRENLTDIENDKRYNLSTARFKTRSWSMRSSPSALWSINASSISPLRSRRSLYRKPVDICQTNILGTQVLLEAAFRHASSVDSNGERQFSIKYVQVSTDEVYGC